MTPVNSEIRTCVAQLTRTYSPQRYTLIVYEGDPDTSRHGIRGWTRTAGVSYVVIARDTHEFEMLIRFRFRQMSWPCQSTKLRPNV